MASISKRYKVLHLFVYIKCMYALDIFQLTVHIQVVA